VARDARKASVHIGGASSGGGTDLHDAAEAALLALGKPHKVRYRFNI
jgi:hypothetical protein